MSRVADFARNIATNWLGFVVSSAVTLLLTPYVVHSLGTARYGVWVLTISVIGYYGLLDLGFRAGLTQHLTRKIALQEYRTASEYLSTSVAAFSWLGVVLVALSVLAAIIVPRVFELSPEVATEASWCILIVGISSAVQYVLFPFAAVFPSMQRFDIANYIGIGTRLLTAAGIVLALRNGTGLIGVCVATCAVNVIDYIVRWRVSLRIAPFLEVSRRLVQFSRMREILSFGLWNFLISINYYAFQHLPNIIIAGFMRLPAVGHYALATGLSQQVTSVLSPVGQVMYAAAAGMDAQGDKEGLRNLYHHGSRFMLLAMVPVVLIAAIWAEDFYRLWIGDEFLRNGEFHSVALLLQILLLSTVSTYFSNVGAQILMGAGHIRTMAITLISGSIMNIGLSALLIQHMGLLGIAIAVVVASVIIDVIVIPILVQRLLGLSFGEFLRRACVRPMFAAVLDAAILVGLHELGHGDSWGQLIWQGFVATVACALVAVAVGLTREERERFLFRPVRAQPAS